MIKLVGIHKQFGNDKVLEEVLYSIAYSVFDNYDVSMVSFLVNGEIISHIDKNNK